MDLQPFERYFVVAISKLAKADLAEEDQVVTCAGELIASVKQLSFAVAKIAVELQQNFPEIQGEFISKKDELHNTVRSFVTKLKDGIESPELRYERSELIAVLKSIAQTGKQLIELPSKYNDDVLFEEDAKPPICIACSKVIEHKKLEYNGSFYHPKCFVCVECKKPMETTTFLIKDGSPMCEDCAPCCTKCSAKILQECVYVLGKAYHSYCYRCAGCDVIINNTTHVYRKFGNQYCAVCISRDSIFENRWTPRMSQLYGEQVDYMIANGGELPKRSSVNLLLPEDADSDKNSDRRKSGTGDSIAESFTSLTTMSSSKKTNSTFFTVPSISDINNPRCLIGVLNNDIGIDHLIQFCMEDYSVEIISFWLDIEQYKVVPLATPSDLDMYGQNIYRKYIKFDAEMDIGLPLEIKSKIDDYLATGNSVKRNLFNEAQKYVFDVLERDIFPRFFYSLAGKKYLTLVTGESIGEPGVLRITAHSFSAPRVRENPYKKTERPAGDKDGDAIVFVDVINFEKRYNPEKFYVYEIKVKRRSTELQAQTKMNVKDDMNIYRRYSQFLQLDTMLHKRFPHDKFPPFPPKIYLGRSHIKSVSSMRMGDLDYYMKGLLNMREEIVHSEILAEFLKPNNDDLSNYWFNKRLSAASTDFAKKYH